MTGHLQQEELILLYYGEAPPSAHLRDCTACRAEYDRLVEVLESVRTLPVPEPPEDHGGRVWRSLEPRLSAPVLSIRRKSWQRFAIPAAIAAMLVIAFQLGRYMPAEQAPQTAAMPAPGGSERVLDTALGNHLERSRMVLVELVNSPESASMNISTERVMAEDLLEFNRLYRQSAAQAGDPYIEETLEDLERILLEITHSPDTVPAETIDSLRRRIESLELLFRVRVLESKIRGRRQAAPSPESSL
jgi:hypothetical protein